MKTFRASLASATRLALVLFSASNAVAGNSVLVGKGTIGIVCRNAVGDIKLIHLIDKKGIGPSEQVALELEAQVHAKVTDFGEEFAVAGSCTYEHITQDEFDEVGNGASLE